MRTIRRSELFQGPIPPPAILREYDQVHPGLADRIVSMAENQSRHRQEIEKGVISTRNRNEARGQTYAFILAIAVILGSIWLISSGRSTEGLAAIITEIVALAGVFIYGRKKQEAELLKKANSLTKDK